MNAKNVLSSFTRTSSIKKSFVDEKESVNSSNFDRSHSHRRTLRGKKNTFEDHMPKAVTKGIERYEEKYDTCVSGGVFVNGKESTSNENFVNPQVKPIFLETIKSTQDPGQHRFLISRFNEKQIYDVTRLHISSVPARQTTLYMCR